MSTIDNFKSALKGGGARPNLFEVNVSFPLPIRVPGGRETFLIKGASLPSSVIAPIPVPYRGRKVNIAGDRTYEPWTITVINDNDMLIRNAFETWMNMINNNVSNSSDFTGIQYHRNAVVRQLNRNNEIVKTYNLIHCFPTNVSAIELNYETNDTIEEFTVELTYDYWTSPESAEGV